MWFPLDKQCFPRHGNTDLNISNKINVLLSCSKDECFHEIKLKMLNSVLALLAKNRNHRDGRQHYGTTWYGVIRGTKQVPKGAGRVLITYSSLYCLRLSSFGKYLVERNKKTRSKSCIGWNSLYRKEEQHEMTSASNKWYLTEPVPDDRFRKITVTQSRP